MALYEFGDDSPVPPNMQGCGTCCSQTFICEETPYIESEQSGNYGQTVEVVEGEPSPVTYDNGSVDYTGPGTAAHYAFEKGDIDVWDAVNYRYRVCIPQTGCSGVLKVITFLETDGSTVVLEENDILVLRGQPAGCGEWTVFTGSDLPIPILSGGESTFVQKYIGYEWTPS